MNAAVQTGYGTNAHAVIQLRDVERPSITPAQVLIDVTASSVNALDWHYMTGWPYFIRLQSGLRTPKRKIPGADVSGVVVEVGTDVSEFAVGDRVFGDIGSGGFAEFAAASPKHIAHAPESISLQESASLGVAALTALQGLRDWGELKRGQSVLINGASGGVGSFAIQVARALGAGHITAVCSTQNLESARALGADEVVDYTRKDFGELDKKYDVFFDNAGSKSLRASRRMIEDDGVFVMITGKKGKWFRPAHRMIGAAVGSKFWKQRFGGGTARSNSADLALLAVMVDEGDIKPLIDRTFALEGCADALAYQAEGHARGKSLMVV